MPAHDETTASRGGMRRIAALLWPALVVQLALPLLLLGAMTAAMSVPNRPVVAQLAQDVRDGSYGPSYLPDGVGGTLDRFTECIAATQGTAKFGSYPVWERVVLSPRLASCDFSRETLQQLDAAGGERAGQRDQKLEYARYWNGYALISRPAIALWGIAGARLMSFVLLVAGCLGLWLAVRARRGGLAATGLLLPLVASTNLVTSPLAYTHALSLATAVGMAAVVLRWGGAGRSLLALAVLSGGVYAFIDFLTNPALAWCLTAAAAVLTATAEERSWARVRRFVAGVAGWGLGYAVTWASKWLVVGLHSGFGAISREIGEVGGARLDGSMGGTVDLAWGASTVANFRRWTTVPTADAVAVGCAAFLVIGLAVAAIRHRSRLLELVLLIGAAALVPLWYEILKNHSQIHAFFTYRSLAAAFGILALAGVVGLRRTPAEAPPDAGAVAAHALAVEAADDEAVGTDR